MNPRLLPIILGLLGVTMSTYLGAQAQNPQPVSKPNIVFIYADDLGYGDLSCHGMTRMKTPHTDRLTSEGLRFTDAHCTSAICIPARYSLLTGEYAFRQQGTVILPGDVSLIISPKRQTLPFLLQNAGYTTAVVGKWHLGIGDGAGPDWNATITPGPNQVGFNYSFIMAATGDRTPTLYVEDGRVVNLDPSAPVKVSYKEPLPAELTGARNPSQVRPGTTSALFYQVDFLASFAALTGQTVNKANAPDSQNQRPALLGTSPKGREELTEQGSGNTNLALRYDNWKYISGATPQLYDLRTDEAETTNLATQNPERTATMQTRLNQLRLSSNPQ